MPFARTLLGTVMEAIELGGLTSHRLEKRFKDARIVAGHDGNNAYIVIDADYVASDLAVVPETNAIWEPKGFVVYPASAAAPAGWGLPIIANTGPFITPYSVENRAPGLDVTRWTPNGPLGQVLISKDQAAGYPVDSAEIVTPPMYFHPTFGLRATYSAPPVSPDWAAYRLETVDFTSQSPGSTPVDGAAIAAFKRDIFARVNAHRVSIGRDPLSLPFRGTFDSAQATAEMMAELRVIGHMSDAYPVTYKTREDRYTKDGLRQIYAAQADMDSRNYGGGENWIFSAMPPVTQIGTDTGGIEIWSAPALSSSIPAHVAFDGWMASPIHREQIEDEVYDVKPGSASSTHIGNKAGVAVQHFIPHDQWVHCANRQWQSMHSEIPTVSWFGFQSISLGWETLPAVYNNGTGSLPTDPLIPVAPFASVVGGRAECWLRYNFDDAQESIPAMSQFIFMRGRTVAIAPHNGIVWAAAVQKREDSYRLIALTHHIDDQPAGLVSGMTSFLRVWYVDMPLVGGFAANPASIIRGVYGEEDEGWDWDQVNSPYSWRGGEMLDVGSTNGIDRNLLKYSSQWVFDSAGRNVICTRDNVTLDELRYMYTPVAPGGSFVSNFSQIASLSQFVIELAFDEATSGALTVTKNMIGLPLASVERPLSASEPGGFKISERVVAAGYDALDARKYCFVVHTYPTSFNWIDTVQFRHFRWTTDFDSLWTNGPWFFQYDMPVGEGTSVAFHQSIKFDDNPPEIIEAGYIHVLDVLDEVVMRVGTKQRNSAMLYGGSYYAYPNPDFEACWTNTDASAEIVNVTLWSRYTVFHSKWWPNPDAFVPALINLCWRRADPVYGVVNLWIGTRLITSISQLVLASYARSGGDTMWSYIVKPQDRSVWVTATPGETGNTCVWGACTPNADALSLINPGDTFETRGGWCGSSFAGHSGIMTLTETPGDGRLLYVRAV